MDLMTRVCQIIYEELAESVNIYENKFVDEEDIEDLYVDEIQEHNQESEKRELELHLTLSWSENMNSLIRKLQENKELLELAKVYEIMGVFESNMDLRAEPVYYATVLQCASCYYYASGNKELAKVTAERNYALQLKEFHKLSYITEYYSEDVLLKEKKEDAKKRGGTVSVKIDTYALCGLDLELLGDICLFFDHKLAKSYYKRAKKVFEVISKIDSSSFTTVTGQYSWWVPKDHYYPTLLLCFNLDLDVLEDVECLERVKLKETLLDIISLDDKNPPIFDKRYDRQFID